jgi:hypothetical protein
MCCMVVLLRILTSAEAMSEGAPGPGGGHLLHILQSAAGQQRCGRLRQPSRRGFADLSFARCYRIEPSGCLALWEIRASTTSL